MNQQSRRWLRSAIYASSALCLMLGFQNFAYTNSDPSAFYVDTYGGDPSGIADSTVAAQDAISAAIVYSKNNPSQTARVIFSAGRYLISCQTAQVVNGACFYLNGANNVVIRGQEGATDSLTQKPSAATELIFGNRMATAISIRNSSGVAVNFLAFDYNPLPFTQGTILAVGAVPNTFDLKIDSGFPLLSDSFFSNTQAVNWGMIYDRNRVGPKRNTPNLVPSTSWTLVQGTADTFRVAAPAADLRFMAPGDAFVQVARPNASTMNVYNSTNITFDTDVVYSSPLMAFVVSDGSGTLSLTNSEVKILPNSNRLHSVNGNATIFPNFRSPSSGPGILIQDNYFAGMSDDAIDVADIGAMITTVSSPSSFAVQSVQPVTYQVGDQLQIVDTTSGSVLASPTITAVTSISRTQWQLEINIPMAHLSAGNGIAPTNWGQYYNGNTVYNISTAGGGAKIVNNTFGASRGMGIRDCNLNCVIQGNRFQDMNDSAINMASNFYFMEGPIPQGTKVVGNSFQNGDANASAIGSVTPQILVATYSAMPTAAGKIALAQSAYQEVNNLLITQNTFADSDAENISIQGATNIQLTNNTGTSSAQTPRFDSGSAISVRNVSQVQLEMLTFTDPRPTTIAAVSIPACSFSDITLNQIQFNGSNGTTLSAAPEGAQSVVNYDANGASYDLCNAPPPGQSHTGMIPLYGCIDGNDPFVSINPNCEVVNSPGQFLGLAYTTGYASKMFVSSAVESLSRGFDPTLGQHLLTTGNLPAGYNLEAVLGFAPVP